MIKKYSDSELKHSTAVTRSRSIHVENDQAGASFNCSIISVLPDQETFSHRHHDAETFTVINGEGVISINGKRYPLSKGDVANIPPFSSHSIRNTSANDELIFQTIWWPPKKGNRLESEEYDGSNVSVKNLIKQGKNTLIFSAFPTPNGDLHVGHLSGPYLIADVLYKYNIHCNKITHHVSGFDYNQSYIALGAKNENCSPATILIKNKIKILESLSLAGIEFTDFERDHNHTDKVVDVFNAIKQKGFIENKKVLSPYCNSCDQFIHESFISGQCGGCGEHISGVVCESCYRQNNESDLKQPACSMCGDEPVWVEKGRYVFKLGTLKKQLMTFFSKTTMSEYAQVYCYNIVQQLKDIPISHLGDWGMELIIDNEQIPIYSFFEVAVKYISTVEYLYEKNNYLDIVHSFGIDNIFVKCFLLPAICIAYDKDFPLPNKHFINRFYLLNGKKFSTSRHHLIIIQELIKEYNLDAIRYYISYSRPDRKESNFTRKNMQLIVDSHLFNRWNSLSELLRQFSSIEQSVTPGVWGDSHIRFYYFLVNVNKQGEEIYNSALFSTRKICELYLNVIDTLILFLQDKRCMINLDFFESKIRTTIYLTILAIQNISKLIQPIMPEFSEKLFLACGKQHLKNIWNNNFNPKKINLDVLDYDWKEKQ